MKHFLLKFNHGVEIGAYLAYEGHYNRTQDPNLLDILRDEDNHKLTLEVILLAHQQQPSWIIDSAFKTIGNTIKLLCKICPIWSLNFIAQLMERFAIFSYLGLARRYPKYDVVFTHMAVAEYRHRIYFASLDS